MTKRRWKLTNEQWKKIEKLLPKHNSSKKGGSPWADNRKAFEGILWVLQNGGPCAGLPKRILVLALTSGGLNLRPMI